MMKHIFVSYAHEDNDFAQQLNRRLRESHQIPWQDRIDLKGGENWQDAIYKAVRSAEALVVVMSPHAHFALLRKPRLTRHGVDDVKACFLQTTQAWTRINYTELVIFACRASRT